MTIALQVFLFSSVLLYSVLLCSGFAHRQKFYSSVNISRQMDVGCDIVEMRWETVWEGPIWRDLNNVYVVFVQESSAVALEAMKTMLPFTNEITRTNKRKLITDYHDEKDILAPGLPTPQPSDSESEDNVADLPLRKRVCSQLNMGDCQLDKVSSC